MTQLATTLSFMLGSVSEEFVESAFLIFSGLGFIPSLIGTIAQTLSTFGDVIASNMDTISSAFSTIKRFLAGAMAGAAGVLGMSGGLLVMEGRAAAAGLGATAGAIALENLDAGKVYDATNGDGEGRALTWRQRVREVFDTIDADGDGMLQCSEITNAMKRQEIRRTFISKDVLMGKSMFAKLFAAMDKDHNGVVDFDEFADAVRQTDPHWHSDHDIVYSQNSNHRRSSVFLTHRRTSQIRRSSAAAAAGFRPPNKEHTRTRASEMRAPMISSAADMNSALSKATSSASFVHVRCASAKRTENNTVVKEVRAPSSSSGASTNHGPALHTSMRMAPPVPIQPSWPRNAAGSGSQQNTFICVPSAEGHTYNSALSHTHNSGQSHTYNSGQSQSYSMGRTTSAASAPLPPPSSVYQHHPHVVHTHNNTSLPPPLPLPFAHLATTGLTPPLTHASGTKPQQGPVAAGGIEQSAGSPLTKSFLQRSASHFAGTMYARLRGITSLSSPSSTSGQNKAGTGASKVRKPSVAESPSLQMFMPSSPPPPPPQQQQQQSPPLPPSHGPSTWNMPFSPAASATGTATAAFVHPQSSSSSYSHHHIGSLMPPQMPTPPTNAPYLTPPPLMTTPPQWQQHQHPTPANVNGVPGFPTAANVVQQRLPPVPPVPPSMIGYSRSLSPQPTYYGT